MVSVTAVETGATEWTRGAHAVVLETKLTPPRLRSEHVPRRALLKMLRVASTRKLTLVAAPPGFGKSTFLAEWASAQPAAGVAWLSLDEADFIIAGPKGGRLASCCLGFDLGAASVGCNWLIACFVLRTISTGSSRAILGTGESQVRGSSTCCQKRFG